MVKRILYMVLWVGFVSNGMVYAAVNISKSAHPSEDVHVAINDAGHIGAVWLEKVSSTNQQVYFSMSQGGAWSSPAAIRGQSGLNASPCIAKGVDGGFVAAWHDQSAQCIRFSRYDGSWSTPVTVSQVGGYELGNPAITTTTNGRIAVAWQRGNPRSMDIYVSIYRTGWSAPVNVSNTSLTSKYCDLGFGPNGEIFVVWQDNLYYSESEDYLVTMINSDRGTGNWGKSYIIDDIRAWCFRPVVAANGQDDVLACYYYKQNRSYGGTFRLDGEWQTPMTLSDYGSHQEHDQYFSDVCPYGGDAFLFIYRDVNFDIFYTVVQAGNPGQAVALTNKADCYHPSIDYSSDVGAVAAWTDRSGDSDVFVTVFDPVDPGPGPVPEVGIQPPLGVEANYLDFPLTAADMRSELVTNRNLFIIHYYRKITWVPNTDWIAWDITLSKYRLYRKLKGNEDWEFLAEASPSVLLYLDKNNVSQEDRYDYQVRGVDSLGNEFYAYNWIRWAPNPANAAQGIKIKNYKVYRKPAGGSAGSYVLWNTVDAVTNSLEDHSPEIRQQTQYDYAVTTVSTDGKESVKAEAKKFLSLETRYFGRHLQGEMPK